MLDSLILWALSSPTSPKAAWDYSVKAEESRLYQFGRLPNPTVGYDYDADYHIFGLEQEIPNPWLLKAHRRIGEGRVRAVTVRRTEDSLRFVLYLKGRYYDLLLLNGRMRVESLRLAALDSLIRIVERGVRVGRFPVAHLDALRARREHLLGQVSLLGEEYAGILSALSVLVARELPRIEDTLSEPPALPEGDSLLALLGNSPVLRLKSEEIGLARAEVGYQGARIFPGFEVSAGVFRYRDRPANGITAGVSFPLPIFNTNRGNYGAARYILRRVKADSAFTHGRLTGEVLMLARTYGAVKEKLRRMDGIEIPALERSYSSTVRAYLIGAVGYTEVFSAIDALYGAYAERHELKRRAFAILSELEAILNSDLRR